ncbi:hypothetical protein EVAR_24801_1 [Eumeta japonica]|uniref:Uncharacterized protein n=1 Tax=Eumeta variegata TaxID=151549 RepID=A0A4C1W042_EUMVA|nr:hypothetical protein EVAR_24801_1 [Eumeta japonica]
MSLKHYGLVTQHTIQTEIFESSPSSAPLGGEGLKKPNKGWPFCRMLCIPITAQILSRTSEVDPLVNSYFHYYDNKTLTSEQQKDLATTVSANFREHLYVHGSFAADV